MDPRSILCALAASALLAAAPPPGGAPSAASIKSHFETDPVMGETFRALRDDYPDEYDRMIGLTLEGTEAKRSEAEMRQSGFDEMRGFVTAKMPVIARAPGADLRALAVAYSAFMHRLQQDDQGLCGRFAMTGLRADDTLSPVAMKALSHVNALQLHAMRHAEATPAPDRGPLPQADAAAFMAAVGQANPAAAPLLQDPAKLNAASDADKCAVGVAIYDAAAALPEAQAANITATLIINAQKGG